MEITCIAIDDEPLALTLMQIYINKIPNLKLLHTFDDAIEAKDYIKNNSVDLLFVDINMPDLSGLELVRNIGDKLMVVFTTAYKNYAVEGFELNAIDYLVKPISFDRFEKAANKAVEYFEYKSRKNITETSNLFVYSEYRLLKIPFIEIEFIESFGDYIKIHLMKDKPVLTLLSMKKVLENLPNNQFRRIHRSYIVSVSKVKSILNKKVTLISGAELQIGNNFINFIKDWKNG